MATFEGWLATNQCQFNIVVYFFFILYLYHKIDDISGYSYTHLLSV